MRLLNKNVIITGGSQGFGFAVAEAFLKEGANILICARDNDKLNEAIQKLKVFQIRGNQLISIKADISSPEDNEKVVQLSKKEFGNIDILVANAGVYGPKGVIEEVDWEEWSTAIDINLKGTVLSCRSVMPSMKAQKKGKIIILSGGGATKAMPCLSAYAVSKAAIVRFAETLADEAKEFNIDINTIAPGALNTRLLDEILIAGPDRVGKNFYTQSVKQKENGGAPFEIGVNLCIYLANNESDGLTGRLISALWDPWQDFSKYKEQLNDSDIYRLRRIIPEDRGQNWPLK